MDIRYIRIRSRFLIGSSQAIPIITDGLSCESSEKKVYSLETMFGRDGKGRIFSRLKPIFFMNRHSDNFLFRSNLSTHDACERDNSS